MSDKPPLHHLPPLPPLLPPIASLPPLPPLLPLPTYKIEGYDNSLLLGSKRQKWQTVTNNFIPEKFRNEYRETVKLGDHAFAVSFVRTSLYELPSRNGEAYQYFFEGTKPFFIGKVKGTTYITNGDINFIRPKISIEYILQNVSVTTNGTTTFSYRIAQEGLDYFTDLNRVKVTSLEIVNKIPIKMETGKGYILDQTVYPENYTVFYNNFGDNRLIVYSSDLQRLKITPHIMEVVRKALKGGEYYTLTSHGFVISFKFNVWTTKWTARQALLDERVYSSFVEGRLTQSIFFIPPPDMKGAQNKTTAVMMATKDDYFDTPFIAFGAKANFYYVYDLDDFLTKFTEAEVDFLNPQTGNFVKTKTRFFNDPQNLNREFGKVDLKNLQELLKKMAGDERYFSHIEDIFRLVEIVEIGINMNSVVVQSDNIIKYVNDNPKHRHYIETYFAKMFAAGQYMMYWKGPPHPYLYRSAGNLHNIGMDVSDRANRVSMALLDMSSYLNEAPLAVRTLINHIQTYKLDKGQVYRIVGERYQMLKDLVGATVSGEFCLGYAYMYFIITAVFHLGHINRSIKGWDYKKLE